MSHWSTRLETIAASISMGSACAALLCTTVSAANVPEPIPYVGELVLLDGTPVDATVDIEVALYASDQGDVVLWGPYLYPATAVQDGIFSLILGDLDTAPLDPALLGSNEVWAEFAVNGGILSPRQRLGSVPYARVSADAERLGGTDAADYALHADLSAVATSNDYDDLNNAPAAFVVLQDAQGAPQIAATKDTPGIKIAGSGATSVAFDPATRKLTISSTDQNAGGDITSVTAGPGLTGGAVSGGATLALAAPTASALGGILAASCEPGQVVVGITATGSLQCAPDANAGGTVTSVSATGPLASTGGTTPTISLSGAVDAAHGGTGLSSPGSAGAFLRSNGAAWTSSAIQSGDIPAGSGNYVQNQTASAQSGGFNLAGAGTLGGNLTVSGGQLSLAATSSNAISFASQGAAAPAASSVGWKIRTWGTQYGIGISSSTQWYSSQVNHVWYSTDSTTWTERMRLDSAGLLTVSGAIRPAAGDSTSAGISFPHDVGGGADDRGFLRYFSTDGAENMRLRLGVQNDDGDDVAIYAKNRDVVVIKRDDIEVQAGLVMTGCPTGFTFANGVCWRYSGAWGSTTWNAAQDTCASEHGSHICTYREVYLSWGTTTVHPISRNGDWLGDFVGDDLVLIVNQENNKSNFEGDANKNGSRAFVCCISP